MRQCKTEKVNNAVALLTDNNAAMTQIVSACLLYMLEIVDKLLAEKEILYITLSNKYQKGD